MNTVVEELFIHPWWVDVFIILGMLTILTSIFLVCKKIVTCVTSKSYSVNIEINAAKQAPNLSELATPIYRQPPLAHHLENSLGLGAVEPLMIVDDLNLDSFGKSDQDTEEENMYSNEPDFNYDDENKAEVYDFNNDSNSDNDDDDDSTDDSPPEPEDDEERRITNQISNNGVPIYIEKTDDLDTFVEKDIGETDIYDTNPFAALNNIDLNNDDEEKINKDMDKDNIKGKSKSKSKIKGKDKDENKNKNTNKIQSKNKDQGKSKGNSNNNNDNNKGKQKGKRKNQKKAKDKASRTSKSLGGNKMVPPPVPGAAPTPGDHNPSHSLPLTNALTEEERLQYHQYFDSISDADDFEDDYNRKKKTT